MASVKSGPLQHSINNWILLYKANLPSEEILSAKFFHNGKRIYFNIHKKDLQAYSDKFERMDFRPSMTHFGNTPVEGVLALTSSGLLGAFCIPKLLPLGENFSSVTYVPTELNVFTQSIGLSRSFITHSSISWCPTGLFSVAVSNWNEPLINCYKVSIERDVDDAVTIKCNSSPSIFLSKGEAEDKQISHIRWRNVNGEEILFLVYDCSEGSFIEQWSLKETSTCSQVVTKEQKVISFNGNSGKILLSWLYRLEAEKVGSTVFERMTEDANRMACKLLTSDITYLNQLLVLFDNFGQMYAMQVPNNHYDKTKMNPLSLPVALLEYSVVTGIDGSDVIMLNLPNLEMLAEKLTENFMRQHNFTRQFYYSSFLSLKSNLCRIQSKQQDFDNLITLHSISIAFKSLLRPSDLSSQDKGPAENLTMILSDPNPQYSDVDKVLCVLDAKDYTVEPATLQSLQQLIQWVADLGLNILNKLPEEIMKSKFNKKHGYDISRDMIAI
ncbi:Mediator of RNA polymerase II transcription subunit 16, partial [Eumeta japonica]